MNKKQKTAVVALSILALTAGAHILFTEVLNPPDAIKGIVNEVPLWASISILALSTIFIAALLYVLNTNPENTNTNTENTFSIDGYNLKFKNNSSEQSLNYEISSRLDYLDKIAGQIQTGQIQNCTFVQDELSRLLKKDIIKNYLESEDNYDYLHLIFQEIQNEERDNEQQQRHDRKILTTKQIQGLTEEEQNKYLENLLGGSQRQLPSYVLDLTASGAGDYLFQESDSDNENPSPEYSSKSDSDNENPSPEYSSKSGTVKKDDEWLFTFHNPANTSKQSSRNTGSGNNNYRR